MKKTITILLIVIFILNLICSNVYAAGESFKFPKEPMSLSGQEDGDIHAENDEGKSTLMKIIDFKNIKGLIFKGIANALIFIPESVNQILELFIERTSEDSDEDKISQYTIYNTVIGKYRIFNIDFMNIPSKITANSGIDDIVRYNVRNYYNILRNLSIAISLFVLIYIGIRMAISTTGNDKAKYKKMLVSWVSALVLLLIMHLIIITISVVLKMGLNIVNSIAETLGVSSFEAELYDKSISEYASAKGFNVFTTVIVIWLLIFYQLKFFIYYLIRTIEVNFLVLISPLVTVTYSIDKAGDNKAQAFEAFLKELLMKSFIQIIHAILYVVFIASAGVIAMYHPIIAVLFLWLLGRAEKITKKIFAVDDAGLERAKIPLVE